MSKLKIYQGGTKKKHDNGIKLSQKAETGFVSPAADYLQKPLAKIANETAKRNTVYNGVLNLCDNPGTDEILKKMTLQKVWGIGQRLTIRLNHFDIETAYDLKQKIENKRWIR
jgi:hypothetical protein